MNTIEQGPKCSASRKELGQASTPSDLAARYGGAQLLLTCNILQNTSTFS